MEDKPVKPKPFKVRARDMGQKYSGFYGTRRRVPGEVFEIESDKHFSMKWMERLKPGPKKATPVEA